MSRAFKFGDNIDTDVIIPARYLNVSTPEHLAAHCMEDTGVPFASVVKNGDVIIGGENFGCGSSREHAPLAIKASGVSAVIAKSFARIFYRNAINIGLPIFIAADAAEEINDGDEMSVNVAEGKFTDLTSGKTYSSAPLPPFIQSIVNKGGLLNCLEDFEN